MKTAGMPSAFNALSIFTMTLRWSEFMHSIFCIFPKRTNFSSSDNFKAEGGSIAIPSNTKDETVSTSAK